MAIFYPKFSAPTYFVICLLLLPFLASADNLGGPTDPDSLAGKGHCSTQIEVEINCETQEIILSAYVYWTWTNVHQPLVVPWSNGLTAHKITVVPPGTWSWDPSGTTCEPWHQFSSVTFSTPFFEGPVELIGPSVLCPEDFGQEITSNLNGYPFFVELNWSPAHPIDDFGPYPVEGPGTYILMVSDPYGCSSSDTVTVVEVPAFTPSINGPVGMCPEGDTSTISILNPGLYTSFEWENGETTTPISVFSPGIYQVTATESHGCTGVGAISIQSEGLGPFDISVTSPQLCPGLLDTLRVLGGFSSYAWSNNVMGITNIVNQAGTYTVTVTNNYGCTGTMSTTVTPLLPPAVQIVGPPLCAGDTIQLTAIGGNFPQYHWSTGETGASIVSASPGTYTVTVSGAGICATSTSTILDFAAAPSIQIEPPSTLNCLVNQTVLDADSSSSGPNFTLNWSTPDGHFVSGDSTLHPIADQAGSYILSIRDTATGCVSKDTVVLQRDVAPPPADAGPTDTLTCAVHNLAIGPVPLPSNPDFLPFWSTPDGNIVSGAFSWTPLVNQPGTYVVTVTNALNGCTNTATVLVGQDIAPPLSEIAPASLITCTQSAVLLDGSGSNNGPGFSYGWSTANGLLSGPVDSIRSEAASVGTYVLQVTNLQNGCTALDSVTVSADVNLPVAIAMPAGILNCAITNTVIDASASSSGPTFQYNWTTLDGLILSGGNTLMPTVGAPGIYTLNLLDTANQCSVTLAVTVSQDIAPPLAEAGQVLTLNCGTPAIALDGSGSSTGATYAYYWSSQNGHIISGDSTLSPMVNMDGTYHIQVTNLVNGCSAADSVLVLNDANAPQALIATPATLTCTVLQTSLDAGASTQTGNLTYVWSGNIASGQGTLQPVVDQPGVYTLSITDNANGCTDVAFVTVLQDIASPNALAGPDLLLNCYHPNVSVGSAGNPSGSGFVLQWSTQGGSFVSSTDSATAVVQQAGNYILLITNTQNGCTAADTAVVSADFAIPLADAGTGIELNCGQTTFALQGNGSAGAIFDYLWTGSTGGNIASGANTLSPVVDAPGTYTLVVTNTQNGCTSSSQVNITENAVAPVAAVGLPQTLTCTTTALSLSAAGSSTGPGFVYQWSSPDGNISAGGNSGMPLIDAPGTYILTVTDVSNFCTQTASVAIPEDVQPPIVEAGADALLTCIVTSLNLQAQVLSSSSQNIDFQWTTPNGQILGGPQTPSPLIGAAGTYLLTVTDQANGCTGTDQILVTQDVVMPAALIAVPPTLTCVAQQVTLDATGSSQGAEFEYDWTTPSGNFVSTQNPLQPIVDEPGTYQLLVTDSSNGCAQAVSVTVPENVQMPHAAAGPSVGLDCDTQTMALDGSSSSQGAQYTYVWSTVNGQIVSGGNTLAPVIDAPGDYTLTVLNTLNGCSDTGTVLVTEDVVHPVLAVAPPQTLTCALISTTLQGSGTALGNPSSISWASPNGHIVAGANTLTPTVDAPGQYNLVVQNPANGCSSTLTVMVAEDIQSPPIQVQAAPLLTCSVQEITLQSTIPLQVNSIWSTSDGHLVSGANTANPVVDAPGTYLLSITSLTNGCTNSAQVTVQQELNIPTGLQFDLLPPLCNGTPGTLTVDHVNGGIGPFAYSLDGGQTYFPSGQFPNLVPGDYDLVVQDANGCELAETIVVPAPPIPTVTAPPVFVIELGDNQVIEAVVPPSFPIALVDTVIWSPMDGLVFEGNSIPQLLSPTAQPFVTTTYKVTILTKEGCMSEARTQLRVNRQVAIYAPNVIKPEDADGNNAIFTLFARDEAVALIKKLQIFDRWGSLVFSNEDFRPNDLTAGWNGESRGLPVNPAVFVWWAEVELVDGSELLVKGDVTVIR